MEVKKTERGFNIASFKDRYGADCSLQQSSLATENCIWLGTNGEDGDRMHLTQKMVEDLLPYLQHFVKTGELPDA